MENKSTVSYEGLIEKMNEKNTNTKIIKVLGDAVEVTPFLSLDRYTSLVDRIVNMTFDEDGEYMPETRDFFTRLCVIFEYTGVPLPEDCEEMIEDLYALIYTTDFYDQVSQSINPAQLDAILYSVDTRIKRRIRQSDSVINVIKKYMDNVANVLSEDNINSINNLANELASGEFDVEHVIDAFADKLYDAHQNAGELEDHNDGG